MHSHLHHLPPTWAASPWPGQVSFATRRRLWNSQVTERPGTTSSRLQRFGAPPTANSWPSNSEKTPEKPQRLDDDTPDFLSMEPLSMIYIKCHESTFSSTILSLIVRQMLAYINIELSFKINPRLNLTVSPWEGLPTKRNRRFTAPDPSAVAFLDGSTSQ